MLAHGARRMTLSGVLAMSDKMRKDFEEWAFRDRLLWSTRDIENGAYINYRTQTAWEAWKEAIAQSKKSDD